MTAPSEALPATTGEDVADCIVFAVNRPPHVDIDEIVVRPLAQANTSTVYRQTG